MAKIKLELTKEQKIKSAGASYLRAAFAAVVALYLAGETDLEVLVNAFIAGFAGPAIKFLNSNFKDYGVKSK